MGCSCFPFGFSGAAAGISAGKQLMNTGSIPFPKQKIATSSLNGVHSHCRNVIMKGGNGTGEAERNFPPSGNRNYKHRGLIPSSKPERGPCTAGQSLQGCCSTRHRAPGNPPFPATSSPSVPLLCPLVLGTEGPHPLLLTLPALLVLREEALPRHGGPPEHAPSPQVPVFSSHVLLKSEP